MTTQLLDASGAVFFARQLEFVKAQTYDVEYADLLYRTLFPVNTNVPAGATQITYQTYDRAGMAKIINGYAKDLPRVDIAGKETTSPVKTIADSFGYSVDEIESARLVGMPLDQRKAEAARRAIEETMNSITWFGDDESSLPGLLNNANIPRGNAPAGAALGTEWSTKTAEEILADVNAATSAPFVTSKQKERINTMLLPTAQWSLIMSKARSDQSDTTIAQYIVNNSPFLNSLADIIPVNELTGAGTTPGDDILVVYDRNPRKLELEIPQDVMFMPEQIEGLEYTVPVKSRFGGLNIYYPVSLYILEKI
jgi:hypothetical protein